MKPVQSLIAQMTLEEKASLLSGQDSWHTKAVERLGVPAVMVSDGPHGLRKQDQSGNLSDANNSIPAVCFPTGCAAAASFDPALLRAMGEAVGDACQREGVSVVLGPAVNIKRSPLCGRNFEYYSEDPYLAGELAAGFIKGVQSRHVGACVKHLALNNQEHRRMSSDSIADERTIREIYLPAFEKAVREAGVWTVMCSYNRVCGVYASENPLLLTQILRGEWGFDGYVMSDWGAVNDRVEGVKAGLDLEMPGSLGVNDQKIVRAVREGRLDEKLVDQAVERILTVSQRFLEHADPNALWDKEAQHRLARELESECVVLLKNEGGLLPLAQDDSVAILGAFAKKPRFQGGGSSHINAFRTESALDALKEYPHVVYREGYAGNEPDEVMLREAELAARSARVAVVFAGLPDAFECESYDREHMRLPQSHCALIERVAAANPNTIVVLHNGSPVLMPWLSKVKAVLEVYLGGQAVGGATVDVLFGKRNPCGRLPETFPLAMEHNPSYPFYGGEGDKTEYREGIFVGYRYYDKKNLPVLFPFGYGLSYTTFDYQNLRLSAGCIRDCDTLEASVDVVNAGSRAGKEVVQLYIGKRLPGEVIRPVRELRGVQRILLQPGERKTVSFTLSKRDFAYWNESLHDWHVETGEYAVQIGRSSRDIALEQTVLVESTAEAPRTFTLNSLVMDLMACEKGRRAMASMADQLTAVVTQQDEQRTAASEEAITPAMMQAMLRYLPLRGVVSFCHGKVTLEQMQRLVDELNR